MLNFTDSQIDHLADHVIISYCEDEIRNHISYETLKNLKDAVETPPQPHKELFDALFKALDPHEKKFTSMLKSVWEEERGIVVANIKKLKKAYRGKDADDTVNQLLFPQREMEARVANGTKPLLVNVMDESGQKELARLEIDATFDVTNPEVQKWLREYVPVFSKNLEAVSVEKLRRELIAGLDAGESIPELIKRVNGTYAHWNKFRSMNIARSETIRASNQGALQAYRQSGVVKSKQWLTFHDRRTCGWCAELDGKTVSLEENWFDVGSEFTISTGEKNQTMKLDYTNVDTPPLHPMCRCAIVPSFEEVSRVGQVDFHRNITAKEKALLKGWSERDYKNTRHWLGMTLEERKRFLNFYNFDRHHQAWIKEMIQKANDFESLFTKYKDGMRQKAIFRSINDLKDKMYAEFKAYKKGDVLKIDRTATSWTHDSKILHKFTRDGTNNIHFHLKSGRKHTSELDIEKYSHLPWEKEVIVSNTEFKIIKITETITPLPDNPKYKTKILNVFLEEIKP